MRKQSCPKEPDGSISRGQTECTVKRGNDRFGDVHWAATIASAMFDGLRRVVRLDGLMDRDAPPGLHPGLQPGWGSAGADAPLHHDGCGDTG
ncbi:MAG: hypothetical protein ACNA8W_13375 [Bradymonadaceae bacterium]